MHFLGGTLHYRIKDTLRLLILGENSHHFALIRVITFIIFLPFFPPCRLFQPILLFVFYSLNMPELSIHVQMLILFTWGGITGPLGGVHIFLPHVVY